MIMWRKATGNAPMTALMARARKERVSDSEFSWWDEPVDIVRLQVNGALGATDTTVVVDSADPDATNADRNWGGALHLKRGDILVREKATETAAYDNEHLQVETVISDTEFTVKRGAAGTTAAAISDNDFLLLSGSAYPEGFTAPKAVTRNPIKYSNFTQIHMDAYEVTVEASVTKFRTGDPIRNDKDRKMWDHARGLEYNLLFGRKAETTGENGKPLRYSAGLRAQIPTSRVTIFSAAVTISSFLDAVYKVFDFETPAGDDRIGFIGNVAANELNKMVQNSTNARMELGRTITVYGLQLRELILPQGRILLRRHPLLNRNAKFSASMFIVDFASLRWRHLPGLDTHFEDNIQQKGEKVKRGYWYTNGGLEVFYGGLTNGYLGNISAT
jgi:hypothetical protein